MNSREFDAVKRKSTDAGDSSARGENAAQKVVDEYLTNRLRFDAFSFGSLRVGLITDLHR